MRESAMETIMECFRVPPDNEDSEILTNGDQFMNGLNEMKGLCEDTTTVDTAQDTAVLTMLPTSLHCQSGLNIFVEDEGSIEKGLRYRKSLTHTNQVVTWENTATPCQGSYMQL